MKSIGAKTTRGLERHDEIQTRHYTAPLAPAGWLSSSAPYEPGEATPWKPSVEAERPGAALRAPRQR